MLFNTLTTGNTIQGNLTLSVDKNTLYSVDRNGNGHILSTPIIG